MKQEKNKLPEFEIDRFPILTAGDGWQPTFICPGGPVVPNTVAIKPPPPPVNVNPTVTNPVISPYNPPVPTIVHPPITPDEIDETWTHLTLNVATTLIDIAVDVGLEATIIGVTVAGPIGIFFVTLEITIATYEYIELDNNENASSDDGDDSSGDDSSGDDSSGDDSSGDDDSGDDGGGGSGDDGGGGSGDGGGGDGGGGDGGGGDGGGGSGGCGMYIQRSYYDQNDDNSGLSEPPITY